MYFIRDCLRLLCVILLAAVSVHAEERFHTFVYVSNAPENKIHVLQLDSTSKRLESVETVAVGGAPGSLCVDPRRKYLYASLRSISSIGSFRIQPSIGKLERINEAGLPPMANATFVGTDRSGEWLFSASYAAGRTVIHHLESDGSITLPSIQTIATTKTAHCVAVSRDNKLVAVPHVAPNSIYQYRFDSMTGQLTSIGEAPGGSDKAGPRHLAFHPTQEIAFSSDETGSSVTVYRIDPNYGLKPIQTASTLPSGYTAENSTAEVKVHPNGKFVWVSNRGHDSLAGFAIDSEGRVSAIGHTPTEKTPRSFDIDPSGRFVFGAGEGSGKLALFECSPETGELTRLETYELGRSLSWVMAINLPIVAP